MEQKQEIQDFFGVYLLCSKSECPKYRNKNYIGFTVNPNRRINQHNRGHAFGGASKTNNRGPWEMVMIIHGFPNNISALRFEWAWQKPKLSRRLRNIPELQRRKKGDSNFDYNFGILSEMLRMGPWNRLPLSIRWITNEYIKEFSIDKRPPMHMQICYGRVMIRKKTTILSKPTKNPTVRQEQFILLTQQSLQNKTVDCRICNKLFAEDEKKMCCINTKCTLVCHIICLAKNFLAQSGNYGEFVPIEGNCPACSKHMLWGDLIRRMNGCCDLEPIDDGDYNSSEADDDDNVEFIFSDAENNDGDVASDNEFL